MKLLDILASGMISRSLGKYLASYWRVRVQTDLVDGNVLLRKEAPSFTCLVTETKSAHGLDDL